MASIRTRSICIGTFAQMSNLTVRPIRLTDKQQWLALRTALWPDCPSAQHEREMAEIFSDPDRNAVFVSIDSNGSLNGFIEASLRDYAEGCHSKPVSYIEAWFVVDAARRAGIGRALIAAAEAWARSKGCSEMASDTLLTNELGQMAHLALDYQEVERSVHYRKDLTG